MFQIIRNGHHIDTGKLKHLKQSFFWRYMKNELHDLKKKYIVEKLESRGIIKVAGSEAPMFLQGLVTNDMKNLEEGSRSLYTLFLNTKGRVMYDSIIYASQIKNAMYIECDYSALQSLEKHLKMYRVRRKIDIDIVDELKVWVVFNPDQVDATVEHSTHTPGKDFYQELVVPCTVMSDDSSQADYLNDLLLGDDTLHSQDPRLSILGLRVLASDSANLTHQVESNGLLVHKTSQNLYQTFRFKLGVAEGVEELPPGKCFPLEVNCDYLHGVSFHKGCYIGQELTARTHHTGVVRKRIMPLFFDSDLPDNPEVDTPIKQASGSNKLVGKLRGINGNVGIGLMRIAEALEEPSLKLGNTGVKTAKPHWWPQELDKEKYFTSKQ